MARALVPAALAAAFLAALALGVSRPDPSPPRPARLPEAGRTAPAATPIPPRAARTPEALFVRRLTPPISGLDVGKLKSGFAEERNGRRHEALDIMAPYGTPVVAVDDGTVRKLFTSVAGGITLYQYDPTETYCYYYAHMARYAEGLKEGDALVRGQILGYVGTTGNAPRNAPHLHFAVSLLDAEKRWWTGHPVDPVPLLARTAEIPR